MLAHEGGLAAPEEKSNTHSSDHQSSDKEGEGQQQTPQQHKLTTHSSDHQSSDKEGDGHQPTQGQPKPNSQSSDHHGLDKEGDGHQQNEQQENPQAEQKDSPCLPAYCQVSDQGTRGPEARRRRRLGSSSPGPEVHAPESTAKRKRTPSRRVVEAAESALLLEEVMASEGLAARAGPNNPPHFTADCPHASSDVAPFSYGETYRDSCGCFDDIAASGAALSGALREQQQQTVSSEMYKALGLEGAAKGWEPQTGNRKTVDRRGAQRLMTDLAEEVPVCRRPRKEYSCTL